ncbi:stage III sporulation protein AF [Faecalimonas sp.]
MFAFLYEWIRNVAFYLVIITAVIQILPNDTYKKYIHFFTGLVLILLLMTPILKILGMENLSASFWKKEGLKLKMEEIEKETEFLQGENIEVEDIKIGGENK